MVPAEDTIKKFVIPVMGPSGTGKSTFINSLLGPGVTHMTVGETLKSQTLELAEAVLDTSTREPRFPHNYQIIVVDTPGFSDTATSDLAILQKTAEWLETSYKKDGAILGGVIYLHDISQDRFTATAQRNLDVFRALCGNQALRKVAIGTTKWGRVSEEVALRREEELKQDHWKALLKRGAQVLQFRSEDASEAAWKFVELFVDSFVEEDAMGNIYLRIQRELGDQRKIVPETEAGKELRAGLRKILEEERLALVWQKRFMRRYTAFTKRWMKLKAELDDLIDEARKTELAQGGIQIHEGLERQV